MAKTRVETRLAHVRRSRGLSAADLARRLAVSRQTIYAIEAGTYVPNTEVALKLARELRVTVDKLFSLQDGSEAAPESLTAHVLSALPPARGQSVRVCQIGGRWIAVPVSAAPYYIPDTDGVVTGAGRSTGASDLLVFAREDTGRKRLVLAGCDPAAGLLSHMVEKMAGVEIVSAAASSKLALRWLRAGRVHVAGSHLEDLKTGEFNLPFLRKQFPDEALTVVTFARWEAGLVLAAGNPQRIRTVDHLARKKVRFINREPGSGSRALLDKLLTRAGMDARMVDGYDRVADGHLAAGYCVASGEADACLANRSAAHAFGLAFVPLQHERYDLVMRRQTADLPAVRALLDVLQRSVLRRKLEFVAGYDTSDTGALVA